jgi:HNH endonuclease
MAKVGTLKKGRERIDIKLNVATMVLTEAGYRCAVPTCRGILAMDMHHIWEVREGGPDDLSNLIALCPTCHALYTRGTISVHSIYAWKAMLVSISQAFDREAIDLLLFADKLERSPPLKISGDGVLRFNRLIAAEFVNFQLAPTVGIDYLYFVKLAPKGQLLVDAWKKGTATHSLPLWGLLLKKSHDGNQGAC